jgi:type IV pilus modification protein PilV
MRKTSRPLGPRQQHSRGVAMIEVLIGMLLIALWMLSSAGLQLGALKFQKAAESRLTAVALASELGERMEANYAGAQAGNYVLDETAAATTAATDCTTATCAPGALAAFDLAQWTTRAVSALKLSQVSIVDATPAGGVTTYTISISWNEPRGRQTYADAASAPPSTETMSYVTTKVVRNVAL